MTQFSRAILPLRRAVQHHTLAAVVLLLTTAILGQAAPIAVNCGGNKVGEINVAPDGTGIKGGFKSTTGGPPPTLAAAAAACGEDHFNWYQIVTGDNFPPKDKDGNPLTPPYVDPPPGGYQGQLWQDDLPWYWNETLGPGEAKTELSGQTTVDELKFADYPGAKPGETLTFKTWLVSLNKDSSFHSWHEGFSWSYVQGTGVQNINPLGGTPTKAEYDNILKGFATSAVPEPSTFSMLLAGTALLWGIRRRR